MVSPADPIGVNYGIDIAVDTETLPGPSPGAEGSLCPEACCALIDVNRSASHFSVPTASGASAVHRYTCDWGFDSASDRIHEAKEVHAHIINCAYLSQLDRPSRDWITSGCASRIDTPQSASISFGLEVAITGKPQARQASVFCGPGQSGRERTMAGEAVALNAAQEYWIDAWQRAVLFLDVLRQRGNTHLAAGGQGGAARAEL